MKHSLFWAAVEAGSKAGRDGYRTGRHIARSGLSVVGALVDCGIPRQHAGAQWLTEKEAEEEVAEPPAYVAQRFAHYQDLLGVKTPAAGANGSAVEDPPGGAPPPPGADSLTHLAQCLRDAVGDHYDFACRPYDQFPFWHDDHLIDAFDWEGATTAFLEDVVRQLIEEK